VDWVSFTLQCCLKLFDIGLGLRIQFPLIASTTTTKCRRSKESKKSVA
jgi:hypothetical protein